MKSSFTQEVIIALALLIILGLFLDPFMYWMPSMFVMLATWVLAVLYIIFALFVWKERVHDEREAFHKLYASRIAFLVGSAVLTVAIIVQVVTAHSVDLWLVIALAMMVLAKAASSVYSALRH